MAKKTKSKRTPSKRTSALVERVAAIRNADIILRLLTKSEVCAVSNTSFPVIWNWMQRGEFPRPRIVGGRSMWRSDEIDAWLAGLPIRPLKGDATNATAIAKGILAALKAKKTPAG